jgi:hypothetical protein
MLNILSRSGISLAVIWRLFTLWQQATYSIDSKDTVVVGLPPPRVKGNTLYLRGLEGSVVRRVTQVKLI